MNDRLESLLEAVVITLGVIGMMISVAAMGILAVFLFARIAEGNYFPIFFVPGALF